MGSELLGVYLVILEAEWMVGNGKKRVGVRVANDEDLTYDHFCEAI